MHVLPQPSSVEASRDCCWKQQHINNKSTPRYHVPSSSSSSSSPSSTNKSLIRYAQQDTSLLCGSEDATTSLGKDQGTRQANRIMSSGETAVSPPQKKPEINWVQLGREVYARYWEGRTSNTQYNQHDAARDTAKSGINEQGPLEALDTRRSSSNDANAAHIIEEVLSQYTLVPPSGSSELLPSACSSIGSLLHDAGICKPCVFANKNAKTCRNQAMCYFCHHPHKERRKKRFAFRGAQEGDSPLVQSPERATDTRNWRSDYCKANGELRLKPRGGAESLVSTAPSTTRDDKRLQHRSFNHNNSRGRPKKWKESNPWLCGMASPFSVNAVEPIMNANHDSGGSLSSTAADSWKSCDQPQNREALIAALLLGRSLGGELPTTSTRLDIDDDEGDFCMPLATSRTTVDHHQSEFWRSSLDAPPLREHSTMEFADEGWWEQEMLGTLLTSLLVSPQMSRDDINCWRPSKSLTSFCPPGPHMN